MTIGIARANSAHKNEGYKKLIRTKLVKKYCREIPNYMAKVILVWTAQIITGNFKENFFGQE